MRRSAVAAVGICLMMSSAFVLAQTTFPTLNAVRISTGVPIDPNKSPVSRPVCIAHAWADNKLLVTQHYPSGNPFTFWTVEQDGGLTQWGNVNNLNDEIMVDTVPADNLAGFVPGDLFVGNGNDGMLNRITDHGHQVYNNWCDLKTANGGAAVGLLRGALHFDRHGSFGGDLLVATTGGHVFRVKSGVATCGSVTKLASRGYFLEGMTVVANDAARWGRFAGALLVGAEGRSTVTAIWANGNAEEITVGCRIEDLDEVPENEQGTYYIVNYSQNSLYAIDYTQFAGHKGKVLATQEFGPASIWELRYDATLNNNAGSLRCDKVSVPGMPEAGSSLEQATFSTSGVSEILPPDFSLCLDAKNVGGTTVLANIKPVTFATGLETAVSNYRYGTPVATAASTSMRARPDDGEIHVFLTQDHRNQFTLHVVGGKPVGGDAVWKVAVTTTGITGANPLGSGLRALVQDDPGQDTFFVNAADGSATASFTTNDRTSETDGIMLGPINFVDMQSLVSIKVEITVVSGTMTPYVVTWTGSATSKTAFGGSTITFARKHCNCGDGKLDRAEQCDPPAPNTATGGCCDANCDFAPPTLVCRAKNGLCDVEDKCSGTSAVCPTNRFVPAVPQTPCGYTNPNCFFCDGTSSACPTVSNGACPSCNCSTGVCDPTQGNKCDCSATVPPFTGPTCTVPNCEHASLQNCNACATHPQCGWCCDESLPNGGFCTRGDTTGPLDPTITNATCPKYSRGLGTCSCPGGCGNGTCDCGGCICPAGFGGANCAERIDCRGVVGGTAIYGICGCEKGNTACIGCDGLPFGKIVDNCGICGGDGSTCLDPCPAEDCEECMEYEDCIWCKDGNDVTSCIRDDSSQAATCVLIAQTVPSCGAFELGLEEEVAAGLAGGIIAAIIIGAVVGCVMLGAGGVAGFKAYQKYAGTTTGALSNPLYEDKMVGGENPFAADEPSLLVGVNA